MLQLNHIKKTFGEKDVLTDVDYIFQEGNIYPILAGNGAGKTTLLKCISGECALDSGAIKIRTNQLVYFLSKEGDLPENITGADFIKYLWSLKKGGKKPEVYLDIVGLDDTVRRKRIKDYGFEDMKRLQLATVLVLKPHIILFDEPLDECSDSFIEEFFDIISDELSRRIVIVTTGRVDVARFLAENIVVLNNGELNDISGDMIDAPEVRQAIADILGE